MARPQKPIERIDFESLLEIQCTLEEVVAFFDHKLGGCSADTIERWCKREYKQGFAEVSAKKRDLGKISLRRNMMELSKKNAAVCIFMAKNYLGMSDSVMIEDKSAMARLDAILSGMKDNANKSTDSE